MFTAIVPSASPAFCQARACLHASRTVSYTHLDVYKRQVEMSAPATLLRREFIKAGAALGGGLFVSLYSPLVDAEESVAEGADDHQFALNAFCLLYTS